MPAGDHSPPRFTRLPPKQAPEAFPWLQSLSSADSPTDSDSEAEADAPVESASPQHLPDPLPPEGAEAGFEQLAGEFSLKCEMRMIYVTK